jgi:hypothetical protein
VYERVCRNRCNYDKERDTRNEEATHVPINSLWTARRVWKRWGPWGAGCSPLVWLWEPSIGASAPGL